ncbi:eukaryotic translation initiation factor 3 subunit K [Aplysia californica]|uniref:Eukaryotic translation initiation factor 3 subunit K n=1 Tax=Aplysia californica TaxID=6500 RepID=A0ABM0JDI8_APLCA|nr:eukaryotic translation initiation factor 3 subunit K [Aplysia californica]
MAEAMQATVASLLKGIDRYNPENLQTLERYVAMQASENTYDLEANLAVLKLYQFNPSMYQTGVTATVLLKALTNLPNSDFILCKCLIETGRLGEEPVAKVLKLAEFLETAHFQDFWLALMEDPDLLIGILGFEDSIRKFVCHVVASTYQTIRKDKLRILLGNISDAQTSQWISKYGWREQQDGYVFVTTQDENIKTKNITEKISFDSVAAIMASGR